jgi:hypothetical protein
LVKIRVYIRENSWIASIAARKLKANRVAIVLGSTIHLWNTSKQEFTANRRWLIHELVHVMQFRRYGYFSFIFLYLLESLRKSYFQNKFEIEAREGENNIELLEQVIVS